MKATQLLSQFSRFPVLRCPLFHERADDTQSRFDGGDRHAVSPLASGFGNIHTASERLSRSYHEEDLYEELRGNSTR